MFSTRSAAVKPRSELSPRVYVVTIEDVCVVAPAIELRFDEVRDRRLAGAGQPREPQRGRPLAKRERPLVLVYREGLPANAV